MAANAIYLSAFTRDTAFFYAMLLLHLTLGVLIAIPFFVFALTHAKRMIRMWNKRAKYAGLAIFTLAIVCVTTGTYMTFKGATLNNRLIWLGHVASVPLALVAFILHRRAHTHKLQFRRLYAWGGAVAVFLAAMAVLAKLEKPPKRTRACSTGRSSPPTSTASSATRTPSTSGSARRTASRRSTIRSTGRASS